GTIMLFGRGDNPINFVSASDVAALVKHACRTGELAGVTVEIGGPENLTLNDLAARLVAQHGSGTIKHLPLPMLRLVAAAMRPVKPTIATLARFGVIMDTTDMTLAHDTGRARVPDLPSTSPGDLLNADGPSTPRLR